MSQDNKNKKLLLGSALAGLMVAAPGLSMTTHSSANSGEFFQTAKLEVGYSLAHAESHEAKAKKDKHEKKGEGKCGKDGKCGAGKCGAGKCGEGKCGDKKKADDSAKKGDKEGACGAGACG